MKAFVAEVLLPELPQTKAARLQYWAVLEDEEAKAIEALKRVVPHGSEILLADSPLEDNAVKSEGLQPGVPKALLSGLP
jgi:hypothetical protein